MATRASGLPELTLAMIVRDGGQDLVSLLAQARPWTDRIVVGDTGSRDGSAERAAHLGARVIDVPWTDDFAAARNAVLDACPGGWVLVLDADEALAPGAWRDLHAWCRGRDPVAAPVGLVFATRNYLDDPDRRGWRPVTRPDPHALPDGAPAAGYVVTRKARLFPARPDIRFRGMLHETVEADLAAAGVPLRAAPWPVHHSGTLVDDPDKPRRYLALARRKVAAAPRDARAWSELADCAVACGREDEALAAVECGLALAPDDPDLGLTAGELLRRGGRAEAAERVLARVTAATGANREQRAAAAHLRAQAALAAGDLAAAGRRLRDALRLDPGDPHLLNSLGAWHLLRGDHARAEPVLRRAAVRMPRHAEPRLNLGLLHLRANRPDRARLWLEGAVQVDPGCERARALLRELGPDRREAAGSL